MWLNNSLKTHLPSRRTDKRCSIVDDFSQKPEIPSAWTRSDRDHTFLKPGELFLRHLSRCGNAVPCCLCEATSLYYTQINDIIESSFVLCDSFVLLMQNFTKLDDFVTPAKKFSFVPHQNGIPAKCKKSKNKFARKFTKWRQFPLPIRASRFVFNDWNIPIG